MSTTPPLSPTLDAAPAPDVALKPDEAAQYLGVSPKTMANWRSLGLGPAYTQYYGRRVAYLIEDLDAFRRANRVATADC